MSCVARSMHHAHVGDAVRERALPPGDDLVDLAQLAGLQPGTQALQRRVVPLDVPDAGDQARGLERVDQPARGRPTDWASGFSISAPTPLCGQLQADLLVQRGRAGDHGVVDAQRDQLGEGRDDRRPHGAGRVAGRVHDADQFDAGQPGEHPGVVASHRAEPDQAGAQRLCGHSWHPRVLTASATRSSSTGRQRRVDRQREHLGGGAVGLRQVPRARLAVGGQVGLEPVDRRRVVDGAADTRSCSLAGCRPGRPGARTVYWW